MARPKKTPPPPIVNNLQDTHVVTKSRPIMLMKEVPFALGELKVLDTYLSRINAKDPKSTTVRFTKEEYEDLMGIERMHPARLEKYVDSILEKKVTVPDPFKKGQWKKYNLFSLAECNQDENGQWWIGLTCTQEAKVLFFNVDRIGYIKYQLKNVLPLTSKHSVFLYIYLLDNRYRVSWNISLKKLREEVFRCESAFYAANYKDFKRDILEKAMKEVNEKTDLTFKYEGIRKGRPVAEIKFTLIKDETSIPAEREPVPALPAVPGAGLFGFYDSPSEEVNAAAIYREALPEHFTQEEVDVLVDLAKRHVPLEYDFMAPEFAVERVLREKVLLMNASKKPVRKAGQFNWLRRALNEDW